MHTIGTHKIFLVIPKITGIFISRINNSATNGSLTGLLSVGDLILAIDEWSIGHDSDVTWVNQLINKKSKILLKVRPFKG